MTSHNFEALKAHILPLSRARSFDQARLEWELYEIEVSEEVDYCPCGQEIREHCYILNRVTGHRTHVGNVCINRFLQIDTGSLFEGLKRIRTNPSANPNAELIEHAMKRGYLYSDKEYDFLMETRFKRKLSPAQQAWKQKINRRILNQLVVKRRTNRELG